jgi:uncharacterized membrane protein
MRRHRENRRTFTKRAVKALLFIGVINATIPYVLAAFGKTPTETLGIAWITEIVAVITGYLCKSYFETKQERKQDLEDYKVKEIDNEQRISD